MQEAERPLLSEHTVAEAARAAGLRAPVHFKQVTGSTNADLQAMAADGAPEWTTVVAAEQVAGRGRLGRSWVSPAGSSLSVSVLLRPAMEPDRAPVLSLLAALVAAEACEAACGVAARCKWPNDVVVGERKLAGVLLEAAVRDGRLEHVVLGVGVNLSQRVEDFPPDLRASATTVALEGGNDDAPALLREFLSGLERRYGSGDARAPADWLEAYRARSATLGKRVLATRTDGRSIEGDAAAIGEAGELIVRRNGGETVTVGFGEIEHLR